MTTPINPHIIGAVFGCLRSGDWKKPRVREGTVDSVQYFGFVSKLGATGRCCLGH